MKVADESIFEKPHAYSRGFDVVVVNGQLVVEDGKHLGTGSGMALRSKGF
jgi:N-acyl-D-amino-acid deacylase